MSSTRLQRVLRTQRNDLKARLIRQIRALDTQAAILPAPSPAIDQLIQQLEDLNPNRHPLSTELLSTLVGNWTLIYASQGTVLTRWLDPQALPVRIQRVWQQLAPSSDAAHPITAENGAVLSLPLLGDITTTVQGTWQPFDDQESATINFGRFSFQPTRVLGLAGLQLPKLMVPVLSLLRQDALWMTSYLDDDLRFGRGVTGNLFVFQRA